jgi:MFS family permease
MLINAISASNIWLFLMIYVGERLKMPLTATNSLITISSVMGFLSLFLAGPVIDRVGRKWIMVISLAINGSYFLMLSHAETLPVFAFLMGLGGVVNPLFRIGG